MAYLHIATAVHGSHIVSDKSLSRISNPVQRFAYRSKIWILLATDPN